MIPFDGMTKDEFAFRVLAEVVRIRPVYLCHLLCKGAEADRGPKKVNRERSVIRVCAENPLGTEP